jgi:hypothetical protein
MGAKRINITLPEDVIQILKKKTKSGEKSSYIAEAIRAYSKKQSKQMFAQEMIKGYQATAREDIQENEFWDETLSDESEE